MELLGSATSAANTVTQNDAFVGSSMVAAGQDANPETITAADQAKVQSQFSMEVLKQTLDIQASEGTQLAQMLSQGSDVDFYA